MPSNETQVHPDGRTRQAAPQAGVSRIIAYGDFTCPWSYLTWRRTEVLRAAGVEIDWRSIEHDPWHVLRPSDVTDRFAALRAELPRVEQHLLPGEVLPRTLAGFVPFTAAATSAYAEAYVAGVAAPVRRLLFEAFWRHGVDLNNAKAVRTLLVDEIRRGSSTTELLSTWGYAVDVTGGPITQAGWQTIRDWRAAWRRTAEHDPSVAGVVPVVVVDDEEPVHGVAAVERIGRVVSEAGLDPRGADAGLDPAEVGAA
ncbi:DsbA family protein [Intrasporangium sp.]|uniref:DsbA family protein n=1 Tax=Intrasporangium sp. TaxID=1925024 RepID=UPI0032213EDE